MDLTLNDTQLAILQWIADGPDLDSPPSPSFKTSAIALRSRGLIELDRRRGRWNATLGEKGRFYLDHGRHPDAKPKQTRTPPRTPRPRPLAPEPKTPAERMSTAELVEPAPPMRQSSVPIPSQIRKPHPAIRELLEHKTRIGVPAEMRHRAQLILHALVQEALRRGWTVTPVLSTVTRDSWPGTRSRTWPSADLFSIDAGHAAAGVRLRMKQRRVDHVPTKQEIAHEERYGWNSYRRHDYVPTDKMRLEIGAGAYGSLVLEDTTSTRLEDKVERALQRVQHMTDEAVAREEAQRLRAIEAADRQRRTVELRTRAERYGKWLSSLGDLQAAFARHDQLTVLVDRLRKQAENVACTEHSQQFARYVEWAERHLRESDPLRSIPLPDGEVPDMSFDEWDGWQRTHQHDSKRWSY